MFCFFFFTILNKPYLRLAFHDRSAIFPFFFARPARSHFGQEVPTVEAVQPPRTLWLLGRDLVASPRATGTCDRGNWMLEISPGINLNRCRFLFFCFVDFFLKFAHILKLDGFCMWLMLMLLLLLFVPCWLWTIEGRFYSDAIGRSIVGLFAPVLRMARRKIVRRKAERALSVKT